MCSKGPVIRETFFFNLHATLLRCKLKNVVARITTHLKHCHATKFRCCKLKQHVLHQVELASTFSTNVFNLQQHILLRDIVVEVGGNTTNNAFQLAIQQCCVASCSNLLLVLLHLNDHVHNLN